MNVQALKISRSGIIQLAVAAMIAITFGWLVGQTAFYHTRSFNQAFTKYIHNRTPENEAALNVERNKIQHMRDVDSFKVAVLFFFVTNVIYSLVQRRAQLAAASLVATCSTVVAYVGLPSHPLDWRCCSYFGPGFGDGVSDAAVRLSALGAWFTAAVLLIISLVHRQRQKLHAAAPRDNE